LAALLPAIGLAGAGLAVVGLRRRPHRPGSKYLAGAPLLIAHRGGGALAPENTLLAFERAIDWWRADVLELDVHPTRDGEAVVVHDATLERTTNGRGLVRERSLAELRSLDAGYTFTPDGGATYPFRGRGIGVPTLEEVLTASPRVRVNIEIKDGRAQERVWETIRSMAAEHRVLVAAGRTRDRVYFDRLPVAVSASEEELRLFIVQLRIGVIAHIPAVDAFQVPDSWDGRDIPTPDFIAAAKARNLPVHVWTVNEVSAMHQFLDRGADGIVTDRPDRLARVLHERVGRPLPPGPPDHLPEAFLEEILRD
jgi:glycerophosphoryl diester phosphodiesterase